MDDFTLSDELAVRTTLARYCHRCDDGDFAGVIALFTSDGVFTYREWTARGSATLLKFFQRTQGQSDQRGKHLTVNTLVEAGDGQVVALSDYVFLRSDGSAEGSQWVPALAGRYRDELVKQDGQWLIARRDVLDS
jgi:ketosteroid isomerase-like protein